MITVERKDAEKEPTAQQFPMLFKNKYTDTVYIAFSEDHVFAISLGADSVAHLGRKMLKLSSYNNEIEPYNGTLEIKNVQ